MICFLDMDGVIVEYARSACAAHGIPYAYDAPINLGNYWMDEITSISFDDWQKPLDYDFWRNLPKTPEADDIVKAVTEGFNEYYILTAPSADPDCWKAKKEWIDEHYPMFSRNIIMTKHKHLLAGPTRVLIDDYDGNIQSFHDCGGKTITVPRPWNRRHTVSARFIHDEIRDFAERQKLSFIE